MLWDMNRRRRNDSQQYLEVVTQPAYTMGVIATELLIRRIESRDKIKEMREVVLRPELIVRRI